MLIAIYMDSGKQNNIVMSIGGRGYTLPLFKVSLMDRNHLGGIEMNFSEVVLICL